MQEAFKRFELLKWFNDLNDLNGLSELTLPLYRGED